MAIDWLELRITESIAAAKDTHGRTRTALFTALVIALAFVAVVWNNTLSWSYRSVVPRYLASESVDKRRNDKPSLREKMREKFITDWVESRTMNFSLIGIRLPVTESALIGTLALWVCALWTWHLFGRETALVRDLEDACRQLPAENQLQARAAIVASLSGNSVFLDKPAAAGTRNPRFLLVLIYTPAVAALVILTMSIWSMFLGSPFLEGDQRPWDSLVGVHEFQWKLHLSTLWIVGAASAAFTGWACWKTYGEDNLGREALRRLAQMYGDEVAV